METKWTTCEKCGLIEEQLWKLMKMRGQRVEHYATNVELCGQFVDKM